ncbi:MAG: HAMP domain-containing sensor histidine kinase [Erysipelotrichaceae bacterium]
MEKFIRDQMVGIVDRNQNYVEFFYDNGYPVQELLKKQDGEVKHYFFGSDYSVYTGSALPSTELYENIVSNISTMQSDSQVFVYKKNNHLTYYKALKLDDSLLLVTLIDDQSRIDFKNGLVNSIINTIVLVVGGFFIVVMIWMGYLIHPLNQIRSYIEKIKNGEDAVLRVNRQDEIGELAVALVNMRDELKRQEKIKEEMIHNISHDLKTPIATIKSYAESIKDGIYPYDTLEKSVDVIIDNASRLEKKVHSLLYLNRVEFLINNESGQETTKMHELIKTVILNTKVIRPEIEITTHLEEVEFSGLEEPWRVSVENIVDNALRYAKHNINIELRDGELTIENDGPSISEERLRSMFKPYEKGSDGQFGLGLSIVSRVVSANGYHVECGNTSDGVMFRIYQK